MVLPRSHNATRESDSEFDVELDNYLAECRCAADIDLWSTPATMSKQHYRMLQVESCFNIVAGHSNNVERNFVIRQNRNKLNMFSLFPLCRKDEISFDITCCRFWQQSRMLRRQSRTLLRDRYWCRRGFRFVVQCCPCWGCHCYEHVH